MTERLRERLGLAVRGLLVFGGVAPFLPAWTEGVWGLSLLGGSLDAWFSFQCHREEARALFASSVCARCLGIYVGLALGALVGRPSLAPGRHVLWLLVAAAILVADVTSEALGWRPPWAPLRFLTGAMLAYPAGVSVVAAFRPRRGATSVSRA
jgi:uncharacterized membrane protein